MLETEREMEKNKNNNIIQFMAREFMGIEFCVF